MSVFAVLIISSLVLAACAAPEPEVVVETVVVTETETETIVETVEVIVEVEAEVPVDYGPVTYHGYSTTDIPTLDPQLGEDVVSINFIENLFVHLTNYDLITAEIIPEAATSWDISEDGLTYTFVIRTDIPWVKYNTFTGETSQEVDEEGNPRFVTAHDFVFGIKRACDPNTGSYYSSIIAPNIAGCEDVLYADDPENIPVELVDAIAVSAPDDSTLVIELAAPAAFFLSMTPMWTIAASPAWAIEAHGAEWVEPGNIVTNGRYVLEDWVHGVGRSTLRNPLMPADMQGGGNIERFVTNVVPDTTTGYALWLNGEVEFAG
ncbi:MAG: hypothetical protein IMY76_00800, partial [Chloroflexi bacterium]|nr:hypothetical protein [Chloroflexota bacterium]